MSQIETGNVESRRSRLPRWINTTICFRPSAVARVLLEDPETFGVDKALALGAAQHSSWPEAVGTPLIRSAHQDPARRDRLGSFTTVFGPLVFSLCHEASNREVGTRWEITLLTGLPFAIDNDTFLVIATLLFEELLSTRECVEGCFLFDGGRSFSRIEDPRRFADTQPRRLKALSLRAGALGLTVFTDSTLLTGSCVTKE